MFFVLQRWLILDSMINYIYIYIKSITIYLQHHFCRFCSNFLLFLFLFWALESLTIKICVELICFSQWILYCIILSVKNEFVILPSFVTKLDKLLLFEFNFLMQNYWQLSIMFWLPTKSSSKAVFSLCFAFFVLLTRILFSKFSFQQFLWEVFIWSWIGIGGNSCLSGESITQLKMMFIRLSSSSSSIFFFWKTGTTNLFIYFFVLKI